MTVAVFDRVENTVEKRGNAGDQHFLLFPYGSPRAIFSGLLKLECGEEVTHYKLGIVWLKLDCVVKTVLS